MTSLLQPAPKESAWTTSDQRTFAGACGIVVVVGTLAFIVGISAYVARDESSASRPSGRGAARLSVPEAPRDAASASGPQAGSGPGAPAHRAEKVGARTWAEAQTPRLGDAVGKTQASLEPQDVPPVEEPETEERRPADTRLRPSAGRSPPLDVEPLAPRATGGSDVWLGARLASPSQAPQPEPRKEGDEAAASTLPDGWARVRYRPAEGSRPAGGTSPGGRNFASERQTQHLAMAGDIMTAGDIRAAGRFGLPAGQQPGVGSSEGAPQGGTESFSRPTAPDKPPPKKPTPTEYRYGPHPENVLDFYGGATKPAPLAVYFHGGGFTGGDKSDAESYVSMLDRGYAMASCNYRLISGPKEASKIALAAYDARNAVRWLRDNAAMLGVDPNRIVAVGASAGGYLAAMLGSAGDARLSDQAISGTSPAVQAVIDLAGPTDFGGKVIAPLQFVDGGDPPTFIRHGRDDPVVSFKHSLSYAAKLRGAGVTVDVKIVDGVGHTVTPAFQQQLIDESMAFLNTVLR